MIEERVKSLISKQLIAVRAWTELYFDISGSETNEVYIFRVKKDEIGSIEEFVAAAILRLRLYHGLDHDELENELVDLRVEEASRQITSTAAWQGIFSKSSQVTSSPSFAGFLEQLRQGSCSYQIECGPSPLQEFVIAETESEFVSLYWYSTG
jgi:hypothetical protein